MTLRFLRRLAVLAPLVLAACAAPLQCPYLGAQATSARLDPSAELPPGCKIASIGTNGAAELSCEGGRVGFMAAIAPGARPAEPFAIPTN